jgi:dTMP kinase
MSDVKKRGAFVVVEGIDGAGTTTIARYLTNYVQEKLGRQALFTAEPSTGPVGLLIREYLKGLCLNRFTPREHRVFMSLLFSADRADHLANVVYPALGEGKVVVCDRYNLSTFAYQSDEYNEDLLDTLADQFKKPDLLLYLKTTPSVALARLKERADAPEIYENAETQHRVAEAYDRYALSVLVGHFPIVTIDADQPLLTVQEETAAAVEDLLDGHILP